MRSIWPAAVPLSLTAKPRVLPILRACKRPEMLNHFVVGMIGSALASILLTVPPHPGQAVSPVNIVGGSDCRFPSCAADRSRGLPDGTCRTDVRFAGTGARA